jgi:hypothetical protein
LFVVEEQLFAGGEYKISATVDAGQYLILKFHGGRLPYGLWGRLARSEPNARDCAARNKTRRVARPNPDSAGAPSEFDNQTAPQLSIARGALVTRGEGGGAEQNRLYISPKLPPGLGPATSQNKTWMLH